MREKLSSTGRCRHNGSWIMAGGFIEWRYICGAVRKLARITGTNSSVPGSTWVRPTGTKANNPHGKMRNRP